MGFKSSNKKEIHSYFWWFFFPAAAAVTKSDVQQLYIKISRSIRKCIHFVDCNKSITKIWYKFVLLRLKSENKNILTILKNRQFIHCRVEFLWLFSYVFQALLDMEFIIKWQKSATFNSCRNFFPKETFFMSCFLFKNSIFFLLKEKFSFKDEHLKKSSLTFRYVRKVPANNFVKNLFEY